jgi:hypothetical protein
MHFFQRIFGVIVLSICTLAVAQDQVVSGEQIQKDWVGKTMIGADAKGNAVTMKFQVDESVTLAAGSIRDSGKWRVTESGYCTTWKVIRAGQERCYTVRREGSKFTVLNPDGSVSGYFTEIQ